MATQVQTIKARLQVVRDELKAAADKQGEAAKAHVRAAIDHAQATRTELEAKLKDKQTEDHVRLETSLENLKEASRHAKAAIDAKDAEFQDHIKKSIAAAKSALEE